MERNIMELFRKKSGKYPEARELDLVLRESISKLFEYMGKSKEEMGIVHALDGSKYIPDMGLSFCTLTIINEKENMREEIFSSGNQGYINYKVGRMDRSMKDMEYDSIDYPDIVKENVIRIISNMNDFLDRNEKDSSCYL